MTNLRVEIDAVRLMTEIHTQTFESCCKSVKLTVHVTLNPAWVPI